MHLGIFYPAIINIYEVMGLDLVKKQHFDKALVGASVSYGHIFGSTWRSPLHSSGFQRADCLCQRAICSCHLESLGGHTAPNFDEVAR